MELDPKLVKKIKELKLKKSDEPQPDILVRIPNRNLDIEYLVRVESEEFTSLCPLHEDQPDFATITIRYIPNRWLAELKSLKLYLVSYRNVRIFHESVPALILKDLRTLLNPFQMLIVGEFTVRGGLYTTVTAHYKWLGSIE